MPCLSRSRRRYSRDDTTPLINAVMMIKEVPQLGWLRFQKVIESNPDLDERDQYGFSALMYAVRFNLPDVIPRLVNAGASVDQKDEDGYTPFFYACIFRYWEVIRTLASLGANPDAHDRYGQTPLLTAIEDQDTALIEELFKVGASPNGCSNTGTPPLVAALSHKRHLCEMAILNRLLEAGSDVNLATADGLTPLMMACTRRYADATRLFLDKGAVVHLKDARGRTAVHHALRTIHNHTCLRLVLEAGASPNVADMRGDTPLSIIAIHMQRSIKVGYDGGSLILQLLSELLIHGADPTLVTARTCADVLVACALTSACSFKAVRMLLAAGAEPVSVRPQSSESRPLQFRLPRPSPLITALDTGNAAAACLLADGLFYSSEDMVRVSDYCAIDDIPEIRVLSPVTINNTESLPNLAVADNTEAPALSIPDTSSIARVSSVPLFDTTDDSTSSRFQRVILPSVVSVIANSVSGEVLTLPIPSLTSQVASADSGVGTMLSGSSSSLVPSSDAEGVSDPISAASEANPVPRHEDDVAAISSPNADRARTMQINARAPHDTSSLAPETDRQPETPAHNTRQIHELAVMLCNSTPSLQQLCRRAVHRAMRQKARKNSLVRQLPISPKMQRYVLFQGPEYQFPA